MRIAPIRLLTLAVFGCAFLLVWRAADQRADLAEVNGLIATQPGPPHRFSAAMVARLTLTGQSGMGNKAVAGHMPMRARQVMSAPNGFALVMSVGGTCQPIGSERLATGMRFPPDRWSA